MSLLHQIQVSPRVRQQADEERKQKTKIAKRRVTNTFTNLHDSQTISCDKLTHLACLLSSCFKSTCAAVRSSSFATIVHAIINLNFHSVSVWSDRDPKKGDNSTS